MIYTCVRCTKQFERQRRLSGRVTRYCSRQCANEQKAKITLEKLRPYAERGTRIKVIAYEIGVAYTSVRCALRRYGCHRLWATRRFSKCEEAA